MSTCKSCGQPIVWKRTPNGKAIPIDVMIYLASPYSDPNESLQLWRFQAVCKAASVLMNQGHNILSPIAHTHPIAMAGDLPKGWEFWEAYDSELVKRCDEVWVLMIPGWDISRGVTAEIRLAGKLGKTVRYVDPDTCAVSCLEHDND